MHAIQRKCHCASKVQPVKDPAAIKTSYHAECCTYFFIEFQAKYNSLAPVCTSCLDNARSLSSLCEEGDPRTKLDTTANSLQADWEKLSALFGDMLAKLKEAPVQIQEFKSIAGQHMC